MLLTGLRCIGTGTIPEEFSHWAHAENYMQVVPDPLNQITEHRVRRLHHVVFLGSICQSVANLQEEKRTVIRRPLPDVEDSFWRLCVGSVWISHT